MQLAAPGSFWSFCLAAGLPTPPWRAVRAVHGGRGATRPSTPPLGKAVWPGGVWGVGGRGLQYMAARHGAFHPPPHIE